MKSTFETSPRTFSAFKFLSFSALLGVTVATSFPASAGMALAAKTTVPANGLAVVGMAGTVPDTAPVILAKAELRYPYLPDGKSQEGWVIVELDIDAKGRPYNASVVQSDGGKVFHRSSLRALKKFRYAPATLDGVPVAVTGKRYKISYNYTDG